MLKQLFSIIGFVLFSGLTLASGSVGVAKLINKPVQKSLSSTVTLTPTPASTSTPKNISIPNSNPVVNARLLNVAPNPTLAPVFNSPTNTQTSSSNRCIVTLWSKQYDVTPLQSTHPGGNVFNCGTDMTVVYQAQHGTDLTRMQPYLIASSATSSSLGNSSSSVPTTNPSTVTNTQSSQNSSVKNQHRDDDEKENESEHQLVYNHEESD